MPVSEKNKIRVVVADDSALVRRRVIALLKGLEDVEVVGQAEDGPAAIETVRALKPDVVILDLRMPGSSGLEVLRTIGKEPSLPKVIILTNYPFTQYRRKCLEAGASYFFDKSADFDKIHEAIGRVSAEKSRSLKRIECILGD